MPTSETEVWRRPIGSVMMVGGLLIVASTALAAAPVATILLFAGAAVTMLSCGRRQLARRSRFGLANTMTLGRVAIACLIAGSVIADAPTRWATFGIAALGLALDAGDGPVARRSGRASPFGARFDMEADTVFTVALVASLISTGRAGAWLAAAAVLRPCFVLAGQVWPRLARALPPSSRRRLACGAATTALVAGTAPPLGEEAALLAMAALTVLAVSFAIDVVGLLAPRGAVGGQSSASGSPRSARPSVSTPSAMHS